MAIGQRIKYFRNRIGMTQKQLGEQLGFMGKTSDVRMAQYESEARVPKIDLVKQMSQIFGVNTHALTVPDIDTHIGLMHTLFALEDMYGLKVKNVDGQPHLCLTSRARRAWACRRCRRPCTPRRRSATPCCCARRMSSAART